jgi:activator of HSP90 ATPase
VSAEEGAEGRVTVKTRTIRQVVTFRARPNDVYDALMTTREHAAFTGAPARISPKVGGTFTAWDGYIQGRNLELVRGKKIVQAWKPREENWPTEYYSTVTYELTAIPTGTRLTFTHSGVPIEHAGPLARGWKDHYWAPLKTYLAR